MAFNSNPTKIEKNAIEIDKYMLANYHVLAVADIKLCEHIGSGVNGVASDFLGNRLTSFGRLVGCSNAKVTFLLRRILAAFCDFVGW